MEEEKELTALKEHCEKQRKKFNVLFSIPVYLPSCKTYRHTQCALHCTALKLFRYKRIAIVVTFTDITLRMPTLLH